ncbi:AMP-binding protein [Caballeronia sordidicola]|uniref:AMP-binding protein n=1 Tax=Caballeronia sordidicola TaxID=196367 RepID=UPI00094E59D8|nr:AMP-binding protein [Caballeronia sordidicola]
MGIGEEQPREAASIPVARARADRADARGQDRRPRQVRKQRGSRLCRGVEPEDAFRLCSSGSTGKPKGAVHTHANLSWTAEGVAATDELAVELKAFVKARMAPHKHPREILFAEDLPKTATGKIQRFKLREPALDA